MVQEAMETLSTKTRLTKSMDVDDDIDELDLIGSPPSRGEVRPANSFHMVLNFLKKRYRTEKLVRNQLMRTRMIAYYPRRAVLGSKDLRVVETLC